MRANLVIVAMVRCLGVLLIAGTLQVACSLAQPTPPVTSSGSGEATTVIEMTAPPPSVEITHSPILTPSPVSSQADREATSFIEGAVPLITTTVETVITPQEVEMRPRDNSKLDSTLKQLLEAFQRGGRAEAQTFATMHRINLNNDLVQVEVIATEEAVILSLKEVVETEGGQYQGHYQTLLQALVPINALESLAERPDVQAIRLPQRPVTQ